MWDLDYKESWTLKNWCFWTVVLEKTLESPLVTKEIEPVHPKGDQSWVFIGRTDVEAETPILWPHDAKSWLIWKDPDAGKDWGQEQKGMTEDEMVGWHHQLREFVMDREDWRAVFHGIAKSRTRMSDWTETFDRILLESHLVLGFCFLGNFWSQLQFLFLPGSILEDWTFLRICPFMQELP